MLDVEELLELEDNIRQELDDHLPGALSMPNRTGELEIFLKMLGMEHLLQKQSDYQVYPTGKIIWKSADKLRGSVEPAKYKHVVLSLFLKFSSDKFEAQRKAIAEKYSEKFVDNVAFYRFCCNGWRAPRTRHQRK